MPTPQSPPRPAPARWPDRLRWGLTAVGLVGLLGTLPPLCTRPGVPAWVAPAVTTAVTRPLRPDLPDSTFSRLSREYTTEIDFAADGFARSLVAAHRRPDRWLAAPLFFVLALAPWARRRRRSPERPELPGAGAARGALLLLVPLQLLFHGTSIQPLLGAWVDVLGNVSRTLLTIQIQAYSYFVPGASRAVALFFAQESPQLEAQLQRQLWLLRGADLALAGLEATIILCLARAVHRADRAVRQP